MVFRSHNDRNLSFKINEASIEIVSSCQYLGLYFSNSGSFLNARKHLAAQEKNH
jgi:hypothetical protein